ncbi:MULTISPECIES: DUF3560 domain-containing protein [unclassified Oscillibacter]|uniref:DUF3560 domain-containing protein n=1 Tax=unclassified Oscillibacter TaxID=2629304 RepID=UPI0003AE7D59|nr:MULTISPECIES: DUF3560 domain-containing protein [unclassified Oscillibacter]ERK55791.1 hypothetical protein HMPREF1545_03514 [Oscillibacter sp. KLE 1728]ERK57775.1 hypothetical protein HMPREF1546_03876 [Oscillibacter sp. KLE 1745]
MSYHTINEEAARRANDMNSFRDYKAGSATAEYRRMVDAATELAERQKQRVDPMYHEKIDRLLETYCRKLAENMNASYSIEARCPSILISGGDNFPVRKKEKQNAARDRNLEEWNYIQGLLDKIRSVGTGGISSDDPQAVEKLEAKLAALEKHQEMMKAANAAIRMKDPAKGDAKLAELGYTPEDIAKLREPDFCGRIGYPAYALQNNNANIRRIRGRIAELKKRTESTPEGWEFDGGRVVVNTTENRLQVIFDGKPDADVRTELKGEGFRWAPSQGAWQRQLTDNAMRAARRLKCIAPQV